MRRSTRALALLFVVAATATALACSLAFPVPDAHPDPLALDDGAVAGEGGAVTSPDAGVTLVCAQTGRGPTLVPAGTRACVDATPVTRDQYAAFVAAKVPFSSQIPGCQTNTSWAVYGHADSGAAPVDGLDWCDAWAFCDWAGKKLCGAFPGSEVAETGNTDGGLHHGLSFEAASDRDASVYVFACRGGDRALVYPYGYDYDRDQCYHQGVFGAHGPDPGPVASSGCEGGFPGLFDMVGMLEWLDACENDRCELDGNISCQGFTNLPAVTDPRLYPQYSDRISFRCCGRSAPTVR